MIIVLYFQCLLVINIFLVEAYMYKIRRRFFILGTNILFAILFAIVTIFLLPEGSFLPAFLIALIVFIVFQVITSNISTNQVKLLYKRALETKETALLSEFVKKLRFSYSVDDLMESVEVVLEDKGDCSVLYIDRSTHYVIYNSPDRLTTSEETMRVLSQLWQCVAQWLLFYRRAFWNNFEQTKNTRFFSCA